jgi:hypothetical protein
MEEGSNETPLVTALDRFQAPSPDREVPMRIMRKIRNRQNRKIGPGFHAQADWAVIGVFLLEVLKETTMIAAPMIGVGVILFVFFGGED